MINLIKKLFFISLLIALNNSVFATSSSTFLISQLAFKNYDYPATLLNFNADKIKLSQDQLLDKAIAAIITEDINGTDYMLYRALKEKHNVIREIRGKGLMIGIELKFEVKDILMEGIEKNLLLLYSLFLKRIKFGNHFRN